jgi:glycolate oxidase
MRAKRIWLGRKSAFGAMGQINDYMCLDGTIPVSSLPLRAAPDRRDEPGLRAGCGECLPRGRRQHAPLILFDANKPGDLELCEALGADILKLCVEVGGCLTGEHGVGIEKRDLMSVQFAGDDMEAQMRVKDVFDPRWLLNPPRCSRWASPPPAAPPDSAGGRLPPDPRGYL